MSSATFRSGSDNGDESKSCSQTGMLGKHVETKLAKITTSPTAETGNGSQDTVPKTDCKCAIAKRKCFKSKPGGVKAVTLFLEAEATSDRTTKRTQVRGRLQQLRVRGLLPVGCPGSTPGISRDVGLEI